MAVAIACCYGAIVLVLRPYIIKGYTPDAQVMAAANKSMAISMFSVLALSGRLRVTSATAPRVST